MSTTEPRPALSKARLLAEARANRAAFDARLALMSPAQLAEPNLCGVWSMRDLLAHIVGWEQRMAGYIEAARSGAHVVLPAPGFTWDDMDAINALEVEARRGTPLDLLELEARQSFDGALRAIESLDEAAICTPGHFTWMGRSPLYPLLDACTGHHYHEHMPDIEVALRHFGIAFE